MDIDDKRNQEKKILYEMFLVYCKGKHGFKEGLCNECKDLFSYACERVDNCPNIETKTFCSACKSHCYKKDKREEIRNLMKYAGPRMMFRRPGMAFKHAFVTLKKVLKK